jgi:hypothetical protein
MKTTTTKQYKPTVIDLNSYLLNLRKLNLFNSLSEKVEEIEDSLDSFHNYGMGEENELMDEIKDAINKLCEYQRVKVESHFNSNKNNIKM